MRRASMNHSVVVVGLCPGVSPRSTSNRIFGVMCGVLPTGDEKERRRSDNWNAALS
jgi:hypothetical protein